LRRSVAVRADDEEPIALDVHRADVLEAGAPPQELHVESVRREAQAPRGQVQLTAARFTAEEVIGRRELQHRLAGLEVEHRRRRERADQRPDGPDDHRRGSQAAKHAEAQDQQRLGHGIFAVGGRARHQQREDADRSEHRTPSR